MKSQDVGQVLDVDELVVSQAYVDEGPTMKRWRAAAQGREFDTAGGLPADHVARWDGAHWKPALFGVGEAVVMAFAGDRLVFGTSVSPWYVGAQPWFFEETSTCPPSLQPLGNGCPSSGGANTAEPESCWTGGVWRSRASGLPSSAFALLVNGFSTTNLPLSTVLPTAQPGCTLFVQPEFTAVLLATAGEVEAAIPIPNLPALIGTTFHHQFVPFEANASFTITATDAWSVTVGAF
jgi:hypothetical protein